MLSGGSVAAQLVTVAAMAAAARLYRPEDFGYAAVYLAGVGLAIVVACGRYEAAIPLPANERTAQGLVAAGLALGAAAAAALGALLWCCGRPLASWARAEPLGPLLWMAPPAVLLAAAGQVCGGWAVREGAYARLARAKLLQSAGGAVVLLAAGAAAAGPAGFLLSDLAARGAGLLGLGAPVWRARGVGARGALAAGARYRDFPRYAAPGALLNAAALLLPPVLLARGYGAETAGQFSLAQRVMLAPMALVGMSVAQVFVGDAARLARGDREDLRPLMAAAVRRLALIGAAMLVAAPALPRLFAAVFGAPWREAGLYAAVLTVCAAPQLAVSPVSGVAAVAERQRAHFWLDATRCAATLAALAVPPLAGLGPRVAVAAFSATMALFYAGALALYWRIAAGVPAGGCDDAG